MGLTNQDKAELVRLAFNTLKTYVNTGKYCVDELANTSVGLNEYGGAFVSVYVDGKLRGCIGTFSEDEKVYRAVQKMAISSASNDSRFKPVSVDELETLDLEISVLSRRKLIQNISEIIIGTHGIYLIKGANRGTFLPQVAIEQNWSVEEFLGNCAKYKAGLGWDGWKSAEIYVYEAQVFNSKDYK